LETIITDILRKSGRSDEKGIRSRVKPAREYDRTTSLAVFRKSRERACFARMLVNVARELCIHLLDFARGFDPDLLEAKLQLTTSLVRIEVPPL